MYAFTVIGFVPYVVLALALGKTAQVELSLCALHARRRRTGLLAAFVGVPVSLGITVLASWIQVEALVYLGLSGVLTGILLGLLWGRTLHIGRMDDRFVSLSAGAPFLNSLPSRDDWGPYQGGHSGYTTPPGQWGPPRQGGY